MEQDKTGYKMTIGLEIHSELKTKSKMFCGCKNSPDEDTSNLNICPICMGHPGTLPVINKEAVRQVLRVGTALKGKLANFTEFDRKNYFYPDIPKGYQISQYKFPLITEGSLSGVALTRIHLEEDTARSTHETPGVSLIDFNRAGVPLMELVTEPVITSSAQAVTFAKELQLLLQYLGASDANMEKGEMRVEVNISVSKTEKFGTKVEVKNINSFKAAGKAIDFEFNRQVSLLEKGESVLQETRGWDENKEVTFSQRSKENANDYRYFPDPDLPKLLISDIPEFNEVNLKATFPETPQEKRNRYIKDFDLKSEDVETYINNRLAGDFFEAVVAGKGGDSEFSKLASNYIISDVIGFSKTMGLGFSTGKVTASDFANLIAMIQKGDLSSRGAKDTLKIMFEIGGNPETIATEKGMIQKSDLDEIKKLAEKILNENADAVKEYKEGKESLLQFFIGKGMKETKGSVNPEILKKIMLEVLTS